MAAQRFSVPFGQSRLVGDSLGPTPSQVLCLHGAGTSGRHRHDRLRAVLAERGIGSVAFDMPGAGDTGGDITHSSLEERTELATAVITAHNLTQPFYVIAGSLGGYTAICLTQRFPIDRLVLLVPAVYAADAYHLRFNAGFTERIRQPQSWRDSDAFQRLREFSGRTLMIEAGQDQVIPSELIDELMNSAQHGERLTVAAAPHGIVGYLTAHPAEEQAVYATIADFLN